MTALNNQAYVHLKEMILNNELSAQEIYSETKLSRELGISRTPFRDAMHKLVQEGYLDIIPSKGFQLHQLSKKDVIETFQVRAALESFCTMEITKQADTKKARALFTQLEKIMKHMKQIMDTSASIEDFQKYDFEFHARIINYFGNEQLQTIFDSFFYRMKRLATLSLSHKGRMDDTYQEHMKILNTMKNGDVAHIYEVTLTHMNTPQRINMEDVASY
ncbi:MAG: GntR family transcriptional regulator [Hespellia sp.]|nr:GntR family transcriptional regulator [Hespellia sp.]